MYVTAFVFLLVLFAEGTRFTKQKNLDSTKFAKERNLPELKHHLYPRTKGFVTCLPIIKKAFGAVYNIEIVFGTHGGTPTLSSFIKGEHFEAHFYINRISMDMVPDTEAEQEDFLMDMYLEKDRLQSSFKATGNFFKSSGIKEVPCIILKESNLSIMIYLFWTFATICVYTYISIHIFNSGSYITFSIWIGAFIGFLVVINRILDIMEIKEDKNEVIDKNKL